MSIYQVPYGIQLPGVLQYRESVYEELGLSVPRTATELVENARAIDETDEFDTHGFGIAQWHEKAVWDFRTILYNAGGRIFRWRTDAESERELVFELGKVRDSLDLMNSLNRYSHPEMDLFLPSTVKGWEREDFAQCLFPNAWLCELMLQDYGAESIASDTRQAVFPVVGSDADPARRGPIVRTGWTILGEAGRERAARNLLRHLYEGSDGYVTLLSSSGPMRFLPAYEDVLTSDQYRASAIFDAHDGTFYNRHLRCVDEFLPRMVSENASNEMPFTHDETAILSDMVRSVLVEDADIDSEISRARSRLEAQLANPQ